MTPIPRVLVVDDDSDIREILELVLDSEGIEVICARDGAEALEVLQRDPAVTLVIVDLMMPRMSGAELVRSMRMDAALAQTPVLVLSGDVTGEAIARDLGIDAYLGKPAELGALTKLVWKTLVSPASDDAAPNLTR